MILPTALPLPLAPVWERADLVQHPPQSASRRRIWELGATLHCSIIGTCFTTSELRSVLRKCQAATDERLSDHDLHVVAVSAASGRDIVARQMTKALDRHHRVAINQAARAKTVDELRRFWNEAMQRGDIPGAYWAVLTHPITNDALVRQVFGDVHMLSHLVGAANRADIRRLRQLELEREALTDKVARQERQLCDAILTRDARIRELGALVAAGMKPGAARGAAADSDAAVLERLVGDLRGQLAGERRRRERAEARSAVLAARQVEDERRRQADADALAALQAELDAAEARLVALSSSNRAAEPLDLAGVTILYVGGRPHHVARLKWLVEHSAGAFLHHDGGVEEAPDLLPGLVSRADAAFFPVDCVSHAASATVKRLCRLSGKAFVPLRSSGMTSLLRALTTYRAASPAAE
jgi:hypothetical protein